MRFSIITVCWNSERVLPKAMGSLSMQRFKDYEWVVIDGASTDTTLHIARTFSAAPLHIVSEPDGGIYDAMNKGIRVAKGEILFFLNSDDAFYDENVLRDVSILYEAYPGADLLFGNVLFQHPTSRVLRTFGHINNETLIFEDLCHQAVFSRRTLFQRIGNFNEHFLLNADYDWLIRAFRSGAGWQWVDRTIAIFSVGGAHTRDVAKLSEERRKVRLQYISPAMLALGGLRSRIVHRWHRHFSAHPLGQVLIKD